MSSRLHRLLPALDGTGRDGTITVAGESLRWSELAARAERIASCIEGGGAVAVVGTPTIDTVVALVAAVAADVAFVPLPADSGDAERRHILVDSGASVLDGDRLYPPLDGAEGNQRSGETPAVIMYTSGTTGMPKGVRIPRRAIAAGLDGLAEAWAWTSEDRLAHGLPLFHVHGLLLGVLGPLRVGCDLVHTGRPTPSAYAAAATEAGATMFFGVPTVWGRVVADPTSARTLSSARLLVSGSAALAAQTFDGLVAATGARPIERYGMTETMITLSTRHDGPRRRGTVGRPIAGVEARIVGEDGALVAADGTSVGTLQIRGDTLFDGYLNLPEQTAASFTDDGWFVTGDAAAVDAEGIHRIVGRESVDIIKSGGYKIGAGEIETVLLDQPGIDEVAVVGVPDDDLGERVVAYVVGDANAMGPDEALIDTVAQTLSAHKRPREIRRVDALPRNAMGKVQKARLRDD